jgi:hypothetical protein
MRQTLGMIISVSLLAAGCATLRQETRMYHGPFGRTEVGGVVIAADPAASKVLVETYDGDLWVYDVDPAIRGRLASLRVGDEVLLAFDDRIEGKRAMALNVVATGTRVVPTGLSVGTMLPMGVTYGAPATNPSGAVAVGGTTGATYVNAGGAVLGPGGVVYGTRGTVVLGPSGAPVFAGPGVIVPGFGSFSQLPSGALLPQTAMTLGLTPSAFVGGPMGGPSVAVPGVASPGQTPITTGNFSPGTIAPGVTTANPNAPGQPVVQGPFTPGTIAPGVSQQQGNAPPPSMGATTTGVVMTPNSNRPGSMPPPDTSATGTNSPGTNTTGTPGMTVTGTSGARSTGVNNTGTGTTARPSNGVTPDRTATPSTTGARTPAAAPAAPSRPPGGNN